MRGEISNVNFMYNVQRKQGKVVELAVVGIRPCRKMQGKRKKDENWPGKTSN